jgi:nucleoside-diphosphate-sugar epimerase
MIAKGWQVRGAVWSRGQAATSLPGYEEFLVGDICGDTDWTEVVAGVDSVIHLAAKVHEKNRVTKEELAEYRRVNVDGTERLARMAADTGVKRFIYMSSVKVNGEGGEASYTEDDPPLPSDPYSISKWEAELTLRAVALETGMDVVILRPPLVYGPGVRANILSLLRLVGSGIPLPLGSIDNRRSMIYLGNIIDAVMICITHPRAAGQTFLVSDGQDVSTPALIRMIALAMGKRPLLFPFPPANLRWLCNLIGKGAEIKRLIGSLYINSGKIRQMLGWRPPFSMEEGIKDTVSWYKSL